MYWWVINVKIDSHGVLQFAKPWAMGGQSPSPFVLFGGQLPTTTYASMMQNTYIISATQYSANRPLRADHGEYISELQH